MVLPKIQVVTSPFSQRPLGDAGGLFTVETLVSKAPTSCTCRNTDFFETQLVGSAQRGRQTGTGIAGAILEIEVLNTLSKIPRLTKEKRKEH